MPTATHGRKLSDIEWTTFLGEVNVSELGLPPWGGVIDWRGMLILVYVAPSGEVFTTDVSQVPALTAGIPRYYDERQQTWWYHLPEQLTQRTFEVAQEAGEVLQAGVGGVTATLNFLPIIVFGLAAVALLYYLPDLKRLTT